MDDTEVIELLEQEVGDLEKQLALMKNLPADLGDQDFDGAVRNIIKRDNCNRTTALSKARLEAPDAFEAYKNRGRATDDNEDTGAGFNRLVDDEIRKGTPRAIAGQRVLLKYGACPDASQIRKSQSAAADFMAEVGAVMMEKRVPRTAAMQEVRKCHPDLYDAYQRG